MTVEFVTGIRNVQILSLAGGGYMGLFTAQVLCELEKDGFDALETTDLFAGTSVGSLVALGLACGVKASAIAEIIRDRGKAIFPPKKGDLGLLASVAVSSLEAKYDTSALAKALHELVENTRMGELKRRAVVPAVDMTAGSCRLFRGGIDGIDADLRVADVALASAAAPTYFPAHAIKNGLFADGGLIANAPDAIAVTEALSQMNATKGRTRLLSIGTTQRTFGLPGTTDSKNWGFKQWFPHFMNASSAGQMSLARYLAETLVGADRMLVIDPHRSPEQEMSLGLDRANNDATATLTAMAFEAVRDISTTREKDQFLRLYKSHQALASKQ